MKKICPHCHNEIDAYATRCPYCQGEVPINTITSDHPVIEAVYGLTGAVIGGFVAALLIVNIDSPFSLGVNVIIGLFVFTSILGLGYVLCRLLIDAIGKKIPVPLFYVVAIAVWCLLIIILITVVPIFS